MDKILILDLGGASLENLSLCIRSEKVYSEIKPSNINNEDIKKGGYKGIIIAGGPKSAADKSSYSCNPEIFHLGLPVLGINFGAQIMAETLGGKTESGEQINEVKNIAFDNSSKLFIGLSAYNNCLIQTVDVITRIPLGSRIIAKTSDSPILAYENAKKQMYAIRFNPEAPETQCGEKIIHNFLFNICGCKGDWLMSSFTGRMINLLTESLKDKKVLCVLDGRTESLVTAMLMYRAVGENMSCVFVDHGFFRKNEPEQLIGLLEDRCEVKVKCIDIKEEIAEALKGVKSVNSKRGILLNYYNDAFKRAGEEIGRVDVIAKAKTQSTQDLNYGNIYKYFQGDAAIEPLKDLFPDEVSSVGMELGLPEELAYRKSINAYGISENIYGEIDKEKIAVAKDCESIFREECDKACILSRLGTCSAVISECGEEGKYNVTLKACDLSNKSWEYLPFEVLDSVSSRIKKEVDRSENVAYDITARL